MQGKRKKASRIWKWVGGLIGILVLGIATVFFVYVDLSNPEDLESFVQAKMEKSGMEGVSIAILKNNAIDRVIHYGYADRENGKPITAETVFQIASVSKTVTATAVMQLAEDGRIRLDDDVNDYLPFRVAHPLYPETPITFRMLLSHTSGIGNHWEVYESLYTIHSGGGDSPISLGTFLQGFLVPGGQWYDAAKNFTEDQPGSAFHYSNIGYGLLGYLVEEISGTPFPEYTRKHIFEPAGMAHTYWLHQDVEQPEMLAIHYDKEGNPLVPYSFPTYPDGALKTTVSDFAAFYLSIMNDGQGEAGSLLSPAMLEEMFRPQSDEGQQALGWSYSVLHDLYLGGTSQGTVVGHSGSDPGVLALTMANPENGSGLLLFFNQELDLSVRSLNLHAMLKRLIRESGM